MRNEIKKIIINWIKEESNTIRLGLIGPSMVGKTALIERIIKNQYIESTKFTTKLKKYIYYVNFPDNYKIRYIFYDIPGKLQYIKTEMYLNLLKNLNIFIFVNDNKKKKYMIKK